MDKLYLKGGIVDISFLVIDFKNKNAFTCILQNINFNALFILFHHQEKKHRSEQNAVL